MKTLLRVSFVSVGLLISSPVHAADSLVIEQLKITASTFGQTNQNPTPGPPTYVSAFTEDSRGSAGAIQAQNGYYRNDAILNTASASSSTHFAETVFVLTVSTTQANTPLILHFNFFGGQTVGSAYYNAGNANLLVSQRIRFLSGTDNTLIWGFYEGIELNAPGAPGWSVSTPDTYDV